MLTEYKMFCTFIHLFTGFEVFQPLSKTSTNTKKSSPEYTNKLPFINVVFCFPIHLIFVDYGTESN